MVPKEDKSLALIHPSTDPFARVVPYERDLRDERTPPIDGLAECVVLHHCVYDPSLIDQHDLGPLLTHPEHREIWRVMRLTRARTRHLADGEFLAHWWGDMARVHPQQWVNYDDLLCSVADREAARAQTDYEHDHMTRPYTTYLHDFGWWLERCKRLAEARRGIEAAQRIAEGFWRADEHEYTPEQALSTLKHALPPPVIRIDL